MKQKTEFWSIEPSIFKVAQYAFVIMLYSATLTAHNWQKWKKSIPEMSLP